MLNWYLQTGKDSDVVISSKVKLARNLSQFNFYINNDEVSKFENLIEENILKIGYGLKFLRIRDLDEVTVQTLIEKGLLPKECIRKAKHISILINEEENICIVINYEEHLNLQVFASGLAIEEIMNLCIEIEEKIDSIFDIAKSPKYGYLTSNPITVGTGMKLSVFLHLPGLSKTKNIQKNS